MAITDIDEAKLEAFIGLAATEVGAALNTALVTLGDDVGADPADLPPEGLVDGRHAVGRRRDLLLGEPGAGAGDEVKGHARTLRAVVWAGQGASSTRGGWQPHGVNGSFRKRSGTAAERA